jgi:hypothetical protein
MPTIMFREIHQNYKPAIFLEPENLAWNGPSKSELLVNLQGNNGLLRTNMTNLTAVAVMGYGLKDHSVVPIQCRLKRCPSLFAMRNLDTIQTLKCAVYPRVGYTNPSGSSLVSSIPTAMTYTVRRTQSVPNGQSRSLVYHWPVVQTDTDPQPSVKDAVLKPCTSLLKGLEDSLVILDR